MKLVSVIIPVYCVEEYLDRCLLSAIAQTYSNLEILVVNDGSPDGSRVICQRYADQDSRIRIIDKVNGGLSSARNAGLALAQGEYIFFLDSDDWIEPDTISCLVSMLERTGADISICGVNEISNTVDRRYPPWQAVLTNFQALDELVRHGENICITVWNKLYKRTLFKELSFEDGRIHEDLFFTPKAIYLSNTVAVDTEPKYNYLLKRPNSICNQSIGRKSLDSVDGFISNALFFAQNNEMKYAEIYWQKAFSQCMFLYCQARLTRDVALIDDFLCSFRALYSKHRPGDICTRLKIFLFRHNPGLYFKLWGLRRER